MAKIYYRMIMAGKITVDDVPTKYRESVRKYLEGET